MILKCLRYSGILIICLIIGLFIQGAAAQNEESNLLTVEASVSPRRLSSGQEGKVILNISPLEGILINSQPSFTVQFEALDELVFPKNFFSATDLEIAILEEEGINYLDLSEPLEIPFTVSPEAVRGNHTLEGKVKFFAYSKKDGAIVKTSAKFEAPFYTR